MPGTKRPTKVISSNEFDDDDDDDFVPTKDKNQTKSNEKLSKNEANLENSSPINKRIKHDEDSVVKTNVEKSDQTRRKSFVPLGFPTSKINISSPHVSRVGLSRKSLPVKPLHPNIISRVNHD